MRKTIVSLVCLFLLSSANLIADEVLMQGVDHGETNKGNRTEIPVPNVQADENTVEITCDTSTWKGGIYVVRARDDEDTTQKKIIIKR